MFTYFCILKYFFFLFPRHGRKRIVFLGHIFELNVLMDCRNLRSAEYENHIFNVSPVRLCVFFWRNSRTNYGRNKNLISFFCSIYTFYLKLFIKSDKTSVYRVTQNNYNALRPMEGISCCWIFMNLDCSKCNEINRHFKHAQKHVNYRTWYEKHS